MVKMKSKIYFVESPAVFSFEMLYFERKGWVRPPSMHKTCRPDVQYYKWPDTEYSFPLFLFNCIRAYIILFTRGGGSHRVYQAKMIKFVYTM